VETLVITAIVLVHVEADRIPEVAEAIAALEGVSEVYSVTGDADLIAMVRVREHEQLADVIADRLSKIDGIQHTETHIAFRTYSQHDLDAAFSLGVEDSD
jgi:DNA-binding Lrp family transcriptional regulator